MCVCVCMYVCVSVCVNSGVSIGQGELAWISGYINLNYHMTLGHYSIRKINSSLVTGCCQCSVDHRVWRLGMGYLSCPQFQG